MFRPPLLRMESSNTPLTSIPIVTGEDVLQCIQKYEESKKGLSVFRECDVMGELKKISDKIVDKKARLPTKKLFEIMLLRGKINVEHDRLTDAAFSQLFGKFHPEILTAVQGALRLGGAEIVKNCLPNSLNLMCAYPIFASAIASAKTILSMIINKSLSVDQAQKKTVPMPIIDQYLKEISSNTPDLAIRVMYVFNSEERIHAVLEDVRQAEKFLVDNMPKEANILTLTYSPRRFQSARAPIATVLQASDKNLATSARKTIA